MIGGASWTQGIGQLLPVCKRSKQQVRRTTPLEIRYADDTKLFLPVENVDLLSRYSSKEYNVELDRLGGGNWQARKARMKSRIREIKGELHQDCSGDQFREAPRLSVGPGRL